MTKMFLQLELDRFKLGFQTVAHFFFDILPSQGSYNLGDKFVWDVSDEYPVNIFLS